MRRFVPEKTRLIPEEAKKVFQGEIFAVYQWPQEMFDGSFETFEMLKRTDTVKILAVVTEEEARRLGFGGSGDGVMAALGTEKSVQGTEVSGGSGARLIVTKQEQPRKDCFYDYPGGRMDAEDEDELAAAKREMLEETGLSFQNWKLVRVEQPYNKMDWLVYTFVATGLVGQTAQSLDAGERIEVEALSLEELKELMTSEDARYLRFKELGERISLDELMDLPELYRY